MTPTVRITQHYPNGEEFTRLSTLTQFQGEKFLPSLDGYIIPVGGWLEIAHIDCEDTHEPLSD